MSDEVMHYIRYKRGLAVRIAEACGIKRSAVYQWQRVPAHRAQTVAAMLGITPQQIRPDIFCPAPAPGQEFVNWPPLPHYISEPERWDEMIADTNTFVD